MADAVARAGIPDPVLLRDGGDEAVIVGVLESGLERVVVDVRDAALRLDLSDPHRLEFDVGHGSGGVLRQGLVDLQADLLPLLEDAVHGMCLEDFFRECESHEYSSFLMYNYS